MPISEQIASIVSQRKNMLLPRLQTSLAFLESLYKRIEDYENKREYFLSHANDQSSDCFILFQEDPLLSERIKTANGADLKNKILVCIKECKRLIARFSRDTINISVIGRARMGKSSLLQSISGLQDSVIPASDGGDCTGTTSIIRNKPGVERAYAKIVFYTEEEMIDHVKAYLKVFGKDRFISSIDQLPLLISLVEEFDNGLNATMSGKHQSLFGHFRKYVEHFKEYRPLISSGELDNIPESEIRSYVAQYGVNLEPTYKYLAVKEVHIYKQFNHPETGKIVLVDTIGLGDTSLGIEDKMLNTLRNNSDAAFLVRMAKATGDHWETEDDNLYDMICNAMGTTMMDNSLFLVVNKTVNPSNANATQAMLASIENKKLHLAMIKQINCIDCEDVHNNLLLPVLEYLVANLEKVDAELISSANQMFNDCYMAFVDLNRKADAILTETPKAKADINIFAVNNFEAIYRELTKGIGALYVEYKNANFGTNQDVVKAIDDNIENIYSHVKRQQWYYDRIISMGAHDTYDIVYEDALNELRSNISSDFERINDTVLERLHRILKYRVAEVFFDVAKWSCIPLTGSPSKQCDDKWLKAFVDEKLRDYPNIASSIEYLLSTRINIASLIEYDIENALRIITPDDEHFVRLNHKETKDLGIYNDHTAMAQYIWNHTINLIPQIEQQMRNGFTLLAQIPNHTLYIIIRKLREKLVMRPETKNELMRFYIQNASTIWGDEYREVMMVHEQYDVFMDWIKNVELTADMKDNFMINFEGYEIFR